MDVLRYTLYFLALLGGVVVFIYRKRMPPVFIWTGLFLIFAGLSQITGYLIMRYVGNNLIFYHIVLLINFVLLYILLSQLMTQKSYRSKLIMVFLFGAIGVVYFVTSSFSTYFASRALTIINIIVPIGCLLYLYELLKVPEELPITHQGKFWIAIALLVHHIASFTLWTAYELNPVVKETYRYSEVSAVLIILLYVMLLSAIMVQLKYDCYGGSSRR